ncbi:MAG: SDR family oxidoreductase [Bacteroidales bacterium]|nr:SDR family oxidoreductase [Bacteroidales bacterium]
MGKIVITGASSDIGLAIARRLSGSGKPLLLHCRSHADRFDGLEAEVVRADFADREDLGRFIAKLQDVEILVNAAADTQTALLPQLEDADIDRMLAVNITAATLLCKAVIPQMCLKRKGVIVNLSSVTAGRVYRGQSVYGGTKAYIETFTRGLAAEYAKKGLRCNCVAPGSIDSGSLQKLLISTGSDVVRDVNASAKFGTPEDVAAAVAFLCSEESRYINGAVLHVDGGYWLGL